MVCYKYTSKFVVLRDVINVQQLIVYVCAYMCVEKRDGFVDKFVVEE